MSPSTKTPLLKSSRIWCIRLSGESCIYLNIPNRISARCISPCRNRWLSAYWISDFLSSRKRLVWFEAAVLYFNTLGRDVDRADCPLPSMFCLRLSVRRRRCSSYIPEWKQYYLQATLDCLSPDHAVYIWLRGVLRSDVIEDEDLFFVIRFDC